MNWNKAQQLQANFLLLSSLSFPSNFSVLCSFCLSFNLFLSPPIPRKSLLVSLFSTSLFIFVYSFSYFPFLLSLLFLTFACSFFFLVLLLFSFFLLFCLHFLSLFSFIVCFFLSTEEILYWNICNSPQTTVSKIFILIKMSLSSATKNKLKIVFKKNNKNIV